MKADLIETPEGWMCYRLGDVLQVSYGKGLKESNRRAGSIPVYGSNGIVGFHDTSLVNGPALVIGRKGTVGAVHLSHSPCWPIDTTYFIDDFGVLDPQFLLYALRSMGLAGLDTSSAIPGLNREQLYDRSLLIPPLAEQKRIVAKVEDLLARVNAAREPLAAVPAILKRFRQSVLTAACSGRLTEDWRGEQSNLSALSEALRTALVEREEREVESSECKRSAKRRHGGMDSEKQSNVSDDIPTVELHPLPDGWVWARLGLLGEDPTNTVQTGPFGAQLHNDEFTESGVPVIAVGNLTGMGFTREGLYYISAEKARQLQKYDVVSGDVLFARSGATLGKVCVAPSYVDDWRMTGHILRVRLDRSIAAPAYVVYALHADHSVVAQVSGGIRGITRPGFNTTLLSSILLPVPPLCEQLEIVRRVEAVLRFATMIEDRVVGGIARGEKLTQAILAKAFRGELVPTEADLARAERRPYEPASAILARIRSKGTQ